MGLYDEFRFRPASWLPHSELPLEELERVRNIRREDMEYTNENGYSVRVVLDPTLCMVQDMFYRIVKSDLEDKPFSMICPNQWPAAYSAVAEMINKFNINCRNLHAFAMDEWADENGNVAPLTIRRGPGLQLPEPLLLPDPGRPASGARPLAHLYERAPGERCIFQRHRRSDGRRRGRDLHGDGMARPHGIHRSAQRGVQGCLHGRIPAAGLPHHDGGPADGLRELAVWAHGRVRRRVGRAAEVRDDRSARRDARERRSWSCTISPMRTAVRGSAWSPGSSCTARSAWSARHPSTVSRRACATCPKPSPSPSAAGITASRTRISEKTLQ